MGPAAEWPRQVRDAYLLALVVERGGRLVTLDRGVNATGVKPALVSIEDGWQIGYLLATLENNWVAVFLPQALTPMSGNVM